MTTVVILSASVDRLLPCVQALRACEPALPVVVVDDGIGGPVNGAQMVAGVKPFVYARNANIGIEETLYDDVVLLNDDAILTTPGGLTAMIEAANAAGLGLCSAAVRGYVCNPCQRWHYPPRLRTYAGGMLAFVATYIPRMTIHTVGLLDERFVGYGWEDTDYCRRVTDAGLLLGVYDGCVVDHPADASTYRSDPAWVAREQVNRSLYQQKWEQEPHGKSCQP